MELARRIGRGELDSYTRATANERASPEALPTAVSCSFAVVGGRVRLLAGAGRGVPESARQFGPWQGAGGGGVSSVLDVPAGFKITTWSPHPAVAFPAHASATTSPASRALTRAGCNAERVEVMFQTVFDSTDY